MEARDEVDERAPLCASSRRQDQPYIHEVSDEEDERNAPRVDLNPTPETYTHLIVLLCAILIFVLAVSSGLQATPLSQIMEGIICEKTDPNVSSSTASSNISGGAFSSYIGDEDLCKSPDIQAELSFVQAWFETVDSIPGLIVAIPYGRLADRYGHHVILRLAAIGILAQTLCLVVICAFPHILPLRLIWATPAVSLFGGGGTVMIAMVYAIMAKVSSPAQRSYTFLYVGAASQVGSLLIGPIVYSLMKVDEWLPIYVSLGGMGLATGLTFLMPAIASHPLLPKADASVQVGVAMDEEADATTRHHEPASHALSRLPAYIFGSLDSVKSLLVHHKAAVLVLLTVLFTKIDGYASSLELQYITKRYGWSWSEAGLLLTARPLTSLIVMTIIAPSVGAYLLRRGLPPLKKDLWLARSNLLCISIGLLGIGAATTRLTVTAFIVVLAAGSPYLYLARSIASELVEVQHAGILFTLIGLIEAIAGLAAGPLAAKLFSIGLRRGGVWIGLPFLATGSMSVVSLLVLFAVSPAPRSVVL